MEDDAGGSSQDRYESDFIDDGGREEIEANKARRLKKGQIDSSDEEQFMANDSGRHSGRKASTGNSKKKVVHDEEDAGGQADDDED